MTDCEAYQEQISAWLDGELTGSEAAALEAHLAECGDCRAMAEAFRAVSSAVGEAEVPPELHEKIMKKVNCAADALRIQHKLVQIRRWGLLAAGFIVVVGLGIALKNTAGMGSPKDKYAADTGSTEMFMMTVSGSTREAPAQAAGAASAAEEDGIAADAAPAAGNFAYAADSVKTAGKPREEAATEEYSVPYDGVQAADYGFDASGALDFAETVILTVDAWDEDSFLGTVTVPDGSGFLMPGTAVRVYLTEDDAESASGHFLPGREVSVLFRDYNNAGTPISVLALALSDNIK